ncbi:MAG: tetratricopeptide repeat protein [Chloroflexota bacterium]
MSFQKNDEALDKAFELIESDRLDEARAILKPILDTEKDNPDVWWLYAHAVTDPETARLALNNVQRLDPNYLNTGDLLYALENRSPGGGVTDVADREPSFLPAVPSTLPDMPQTGKKPDDDENEWDAFDEDNDDTPVPLFRRPAFLLVVGFLVFLIIAAFVVLNPQSQPPIISETIVPTDASSVAEIPTVVFETLAPTDAVSIAQVPTVENIVPTGEVPTLEPAMSTFPAIGTTPSSEVSFDNIVSALGAFELPGQAVAMEKTTLGNNTVMVSVCTEAGAKLRQTLPAVSDALSTEFQSLPADLDGLGIRMLDCASNTTLLVIGVSTDDIRAFTAGNLDKAAFQAKWQPLN